MEELLSLLYRLACEYAIEDEDMQELCEKFGVSFEALEKFTLGEQP